MPRDGSSVYVLPFPDVVENTEIESAVYNGFVHDVAQDLNTPRPIVAGGTNATSADQALFNVGGEKAAMLVTNYDTHVWQSGSFYSAGSAIGPAQNGHPFSGVAYVSDPPAFPPTNQNVVVEARDATDERLYFRRKSGGVWGAWTAQDAYLRSIKVQRFIASGTYTPSAGLIYCTIECWGAGGGGGGTLGAASQTRVASGGGGGSHSVKVASAAAIGASKAVTIGAAGAGGLAGANNGSTGGDSSVSTLCIGKGGGGGFASGFSAAAGAAGGLGTGDVTALGMMGNTVGGDTGASMTIGIGGAGGGSSVGYGGPGGASAGNSVVGFSAGGFASGGGGASSNNSATTAAGGPGAPGLVVITEYCSAL